MLELDMSRRNFVRFSVMGTGVAAAALAVNPGEALAEPASVPVEKDYPNQIKIAHLSDTHYFSKKLYADCPDFTLAEHSDRKMFRESGAILDKALDEVVAYAPDLVLVSGDLTKDGEWACHEDVHAKLVGVRERLRAAGKETLICVINGNHDINNDLNGRDFSSGAAEHTKTTSPLEFKDLYADCGYDAAFAAFDKGGSCGGSLSYAVRPTKGVTLIVVDSCKYSTDQNGLDTDEHVTSGVVGEALLAWVESQAKQARAAGDIVLVMQHHGVIPHFSMEPELMGEYLVDNYEECQRRYADAGVSAVFTGHMHANDIACITTESGNVLYDIETCSTVTYPSDIRFATLNWKRLESSADVEAALAVENHQLGAVAYEDFDTGALTHIDNITAYAEECLLSVDVVKTMLVDALVAPAMDQMASAGGVKPALAGLLASLGVGNGSVEALDPALFGMLLAMLPQTQDHAFTIDLGSLSSLIKSYGTLGIWSHAAEGRIVLERIDAVSATMQPVALSLTAEERTAVERACASLPAPLAAGKYWSYYIDANSFATFMSTLYANIDTNVLQKGKEQTLELLRALVETFALQAVDKDGKTVFDLVKFAYGDHLYGNETCPSWVEAALAGLRLTGSDASGNPVSDGSLISFVRAAVNDGDNLEALTALLKKVKFKLSELCVKNEGSGPLGLIGLVVSNVGSVLGYLGDAPANMIPNIPAAADFAAGALSSLTHDVNEVSDRALTMKARLVDPDWTDGGTDGTDGGTGNNGGTGGGSNGSGTGAGGAGGTGSNNGGSSGSGTGTGGSITTGGSGSAKPAQGKLPQTGDSTAFASATLVGLGALAGAYKVAQIEGDPLDIDSFDTDFSAPETEE